MKPSELLTKPEINFFLSILIPLVALSVTYGTLSEKIYYVETATNTVKAQCDENKNDNNEIKIRLAEIQKDILYIREKIDERK